jgi:serine protease Do
MLKYFSHGRCCRSGGVSKLFILAVVLIFISTWSFSACSQEGEQAKNPSEKKSGNAASSEAAAPATEAAQMTREVFVSAIIEVAKRNIPSVVHIQITETKEVANPLVPFENNPGFRYFFGLPKNMPKKFKQEMVGIGSGIIMDAQGHILTNNHVVDGANKIQVLLSDGRQFPGKVVGTDPKTDLAVIEISVPESLPALAFGDSDKVQVGQWVVAIGQPEGLNESVTQGIISAKHRTGLSEPTSYQDFLQTDAAINPGNSGGPLLNLNNEVIGINSAILSQSGGFMGIGFAIPSNMAVYVAKQLIEHGKVTRGWLGVSVGTITPSMAESLGVQPNQGALIVGVVKGGPADQAGLKKNDIVTAFEGKPISSPSFLRNDVAMATVGTEAKLTVIRDGQKIEVPVKIGNMEDARKLLAADAKSRLGGEFSSVTAEEAQKYHLPYQLGVVVSSVEADSPLAKAGFTAGDLILEVNGQAVPNAESFDALVGGLPPGQKVILLAMDPKTGEHGNVKVALQ